MLQNGIFWNGKNHPKRSKSIQKLVRRWKNFKNFDTGSLAKIVEKTPKNLTSKKFYRNIAWRVEFCNYFSRKICVFPRWLLLIIGQHSFQSMVKYHQGWTGKSYEKQGASWNDEEIPWQLRDDHQKIEKGLHHRDLKMKSWEGVGTMPKVVKSRNWQK